MRDIEHVEVNEYFAGRGPPADLPQSVRYHPIAAVKPALRKVANIESNQAVESVAMKPLPQTHDLLTVAPRVVWFEPAEKALADPVRFLAYLMTYGTLDDIAVVRRYLDLADFREALERAPPGIIDERSWAY
jgi:hypothetical protein